MSIEAELVSALAIQSIMSTRGAGTFASFVVEQVHLCCASSHEWLNHQTLNKLFLYTISMCLAGADITFCRKMASEE